MLRHAIIPHHYHTAWFILCSNGFARAHDTAATFYTPYATLLFYTCLPPHGTTTAARYTLFVTTMQHNIALQHRTRWRTTGALNIEQHTLHTCTCAHLCRHRHTRGETTRTPSLCYLRGDYPAAVRAWWAAGRAYRRVPESGRTAAWRYTSTGLFLRCRFLRVRQVTGRFTFSIPSHRSHWLVSPVSNTLGSWFWDGSRLLYTDYSCTHPCSSTTPDSHIIHLCSTVRTHAHTRAYRTTHARAPGVTPLRWRAVTPPALLTTAGILPELPYQVVLHSITSTRYSLQCLLQAATVQTLILYASRFHGKPPFLYRCSLSCPSIQPTIPLRYRCDYHPHFVWMTLSSIIQASCNNPPSHMTSGTPAHALFYHVTCTLYCYQWLFHSGWFGSLSQTPPCYVPMPATT